MRETNTSSLENLTVWRRDSPTPYLLSGLVLLIGIIAIAIALLILMCSNRKRPLPSTSSGELISWEMPGKQAATGVDTKPNIVVIMAGDEMPTYLATPTETEAAVTSIQICQCNSQV